MARNMTRRELARMLAAAPAIGAVASAADSAGSSQPAQPSAYTGPLTGITRGIEDRRFDPVVFTRDLYAAAPRRLRFQARTRREAEEWQRALSAKLTDLVGGFPTERGPLRPATLETRAFPGYRREKIVFDSRPGVSGLAYVLLPTNARAPAPLVVCVPGHGRGVDDIVGIDEQGRDRADKAGYQHDFAI